MTITENTTLVTIAEALDRLGSKHIAHAIKLAKKENLIHYVEGTPMVPLDEFVVAWQTHPTPTNGGYVIDLPENYVVIVQFLRDHVAPQARKGLLEPNGKKLSNTFSNEVFAGFIKGAKKVSNGRGAPWVAPRNELEEYLRNRGAIA